MALENAALAYVFADKKDEAHLYLKKAGSFLDSRRCTIPGCWVLTTWCRLGKGRGGGAYVFGGKMDEAHPYLKKAGSFLDSTRCTIPGWIGKDHLVSFGGGGGAYVFAGKKDEAHPYLKKAGSFLDSTRCTIRGCWVLTIWCQCWGGGGGEVEGRRRKRNVYTLPNLVKCIEKLRGIVKPGTLKKKQLS